MVSVASGNSRRIIGKIVDKPPRGVGVGRMAEVADEQEI